MTEYTNRQRKNYRIKKLKKRIQKRIDSIKKIWKTTTDE
jgi:hypothetical protein